MTNASEKSSSTSPKQKSRFSVENIKILWRTFVAPDFFADENTLSDHLANERTWHNWLALSNATSWMGIIIAQVSKITITLGPDQQDILHKKARFCQVISIIILLIGTYRFFCEQQAINGTGRRASQWSLLATGVLLFFLAVYFLTMLLVAKPTLFGSS